MSMGSSRAYKATPVEVLHAETVMLPMQDYFDLLQVKVQSRVKIEG